MVACIVPMQRPWACLLFQKKGKKELTRVQQWPSRRKFTCMLSCLRGSEVHITYVFLKVLLISSGEKQKPNHIELRADTILSSMLCNLSDCLAGYEGSPPQVGLHVCALAASLHVEAIHFMAESRSRRGHRRGHLVTGWLARSVAYKMCPLTQNNTPANTRRHTTNSKY